MHEAMRVHAWLATVLTGYRSRHSIDHFRISERILLDNEISMGLLQVIPTIPNAMSHLHFYLFFRMMPN